MVHVRSSDAVRKYAATPKLNIRIFCHNTIANAIGMPIYKANAKIIVNGVPLDDKWRSVQITQRTGAKQNPRMNFAISAAT